MCDDCGWEDALEEIDDLLEDESVEFARDTLEGIKGWVADKEHVTHNQLTAIENIAAKRRG